MRTLPAWAWLIAVVFSGILQAEDDVGATTASEEANKEVMQEGAEKGGRRNITLGAMYREEFEQQVGVTALKSGVLYKVEVAGKGKTPKLSDWIKVNYAGKHVDGRIFDKSKEGEPARMRVDRTVPGWQEVLPRMREGDKWEVVIPSHMGYGAKGTGAGNIGANETLVFSIELVEVEDPAKKAEVKSP
jgi:FKBP-type peptidyl-prolyl cis-trans isomerase